MALRDDPYYLAGKKVGEIIMKSCGLIANFFWCGIVKATLKSLVWGIIYVFLLVLFVVFEVNDYDTSQVLLLTFFAISIANIYVLIVDWRILKRKKYFKNLFTKIDLKETDKNYPEFLSETAVSEYVTIVKFLSKVPLSVWESKKEFIETQMNQKIISVENALTDNNIIFLSIQLKQLPDVLEWNDDFINYEEDVFALGKSVYGLSVINLNKHAHMLLCGTTGCGKSNILKCLIHQAILKGYECILIDFKRGVSFTSFAEKINVCYEYETASNLLIKMIKETESRLDAFRELKVDNLNDYNRISKKKSRIIIFIDELAELFNCSDKELAKQLRTSVETLSRLSRAGGIHLVMGVQRPDSTVISGQIKSNVTLRVCGKFSDKEPSRIVLNSNDACLLPNTKGRFIVKDDFCEQVQMFYYNDAQTQDIQTLQVKESESCCDKTETDVVFDFSDIN